MHLPLFLQIGDVAYNLSQIRAIVMPPDGSAKLWLAHPHDDVTVYQPIDTASLRRLLAELRSRGALIEIQLD